MVSGPKLMAVTLNELRCTSLLGSASMMSIMAFCASGMYIMSISVPFFSGQTNFSPFTAA